jgi:hypothetical protein
MVESTVCVAVKRPLHKPLFLISQAVKCPAVYFGGLISVLACQRAGWRPRNMQVVPLHVVACFFRIMDVGQGYDLDRLSIYQFTTS